MEAYCPIIISFKSGYHPYRGETKLHALIRLIAMNFIDRTTEYSNTRYTCQEDVLIKFINNACGDKRVVLIIDELDMLCAP